jgi:hypothetical protein
LGFVIALGGAGAWYFAAAYQNGRLPGGGSTPGLVLGIVGGLIIVFECALWLRKTKPFRTRRIFGTAQSWMKAHIWLGLLVLPLAVMHSGFAFGGTLTSIVMWLLLIVIASGIFGLWMQNLVPKLLLEHVQGETVFSQIDLVKRQYANEAARIVFLSCGETQDPTIAATTSNVNNLSSDDATAKVVGAQRRVGPIVVKTSAGSGDSLRLANPKVLRQAYEEIIQPYMANSVPVATPLANQRRSQAYFDALRTSAGEEAREAINSLQQICDRARQLNLQRRLHYLLHAWLAVHLPLSISLLILLVIHVIYALRFG